LTRERLASVLQKEVQTTMISTSCYSGGWIMTPNLNEWAVTKSIGQQVGGTIFAACLLDSIITTSVRTGREEKLIKVDDEGQEFSDTMNALARKIKVEYEARCGTLWAQHKFSFAVQDDLWTEARGKRTGLPLLNYQERWESLPEAPLEEIVYPNGGGRLTGSIMSKPLGALYNIIRVKATRYMNSYPGLDNAGTNVSCHSGFHRLVQGRPFEFEDLYRLNGILDYRQGQMGLAEVYCRTLEIGVPENRQADQFDEYGWLDSLHKAKRATPADDSKAAIDVLDRYDAIHSLVWNARIFDSPGPNQGWDYTKPEAYLAFRLTESPMPIPQIEKKLEELLQRTYSLPNPVF
jgi:hypothetical protein